MPIVQPIDTVAAYIDSAIRVLYNSNKEIFFEIFGDDAVYLWSKFVDHYDANEGSFICYLDLKNQRALARYVVAYAEKNDMRLKK